jgi:hypothetical protein
MVIDVMRRLAVCPIVLSVLITPSVGGQFNRPCAKVNEGK